MPLGEWNIDDELRAEVDSAANTWRQGDVFEETAIVHYALGSHPLTEGAARNAGPSAVLHRLDLAVVISQTCEVVRSCVERPLVHVAAVVALSGQELDEALRGWRPRYVHLPWVGDDRFADLELQGAVEKSVLLHSNLARRCPDTASASKFGMGLGRHRARFAFPDDLAPTLRPLVNRLREKARKSTPQGRRIDEVWEIRVRADPDWDAAQQSIELVFLVDPRSLPPQPVESELPASIHSQIQSLDVQRLAELLDDQALDAGSRNVTWQRLADAWSSFAKPAGSIVEVSGVAVPINEFTRFDEFTAPQLDLDYLSD